MSAEKPDFSKSEKASWGSRAYQALAGRSRGVINSLGIGATLVLAACGPGETTPLPAAPAPPAPTPPAPTAPVMPEKKAEPEENKALIPEELAALKDKIVALEKENLDSKAAKAAGNPTHTDDEITAVEMELLAANRKEKLHNRAVAELDPKPAEPEKAAEPEPEAAKPKQPPLVEAPEKEPEPEVAKTAGAVIDLPNPRGKGPVRIQLPETVTPNTPIILALNKWANPNGVRGYTDAKVAWDENGLGNQHTGKGILVALSGPMDSEEPVAWDSLAEVIKMVKGAVKKETGVELAKSEGIIIIPQGAGGFLSLHPLLEGDHKGQVSTLLLFDGLPNNRERIEGNALAFARWMQEWILGDNRRRIAAIARLRTNLRTTDKLGKWLTKEGVAVARRPDLPADFDALTEAEKGARFLRIVSPKIDGKPNTGVEHIDLAKDGRLRTLLEWAQQR